MIPLISFGDRKLVPIFASQSGSYGCGAFLVRRAEKNELSIETSLTFL